jgi:ribosomal protein S18 acetylase RimI-like enzyme
MDYFESNHKKEMKKIYQSSFPKNERFPFWILKHCSKEKNVLFNAILDNDKIIGIEYIINCENYAYLMYLAVDEDQREKGYGTKILDDLTKKYKTIILSIERTNKDLNDIREKRKNFYLKNGFYETNKFIEDTGVQYEILCTNKDFTITKEKLEERYTKMTNSIMMKKLIGRIFNVYNINFIK